MSSGPSTDEDVAGQVRTTIGQARLLMNKKGRFEQFSGLVDNCANGTGEKKTTVMDLQGFWDLIYFQVGPIPTQSFSFSALCLGFIGVHTLAIHDLHFVRLRTWTRTLRS